MKCKQTDMCSYLPENRNQLYLFGNTTDLVLYGDQHLKKCQHIKLKHVQTVSQNYCSIEHFDETSTMQTHNNNTVYDANPDVNINISTT